MQQPEVPLSQTPVEASAPLQEFAIELGIAGIPEFTANLIGGGTYTLNALTPTARFPLLVNSLKSAIHAQRACTIITASDPLELIRRLEEGGCPNVAQLIEEKRLIVLSTQDEFSKKIFRFGADRFLQELDTFGVVKNSFMIFDQADELFSLHDLFLASQQVKIVSQWIKRQNIAGLLAFTRSSDGQMAALNALLDDFAGNARLGGGRDGLEITFTYWRSLGGVLAARNFNLYVGSDGGYVVSRRAMERGAPTPTVGHAAMDQGQGHSATNYPAGPHQAPITPTQIAQELQQVMAPSMPIASAPAFKQDLAQHYIYLDPDFDSIVAVLPGQASRVPGLLDLIHAATGRPKSMIMLSSELSLAFTDLAKAVHLLRKTLGELAQIVIREKSTIITEHQKKFLLQCGANTVIGKHVALEHYVQFLGILRNQVFSRPVDPVFANLEAGFLSESGADFQAHDDRSESFPDRPLPSLSAALPDIGDDASALSELQAPAPAVEQAYTYKMGLKSEPIAQKVIEKAKRSAIKVGV
jgi:Cellulose biosynthesis GIL